jgi:hypothetical protein
MVMDESRLGRHCVRSPASRASRPRTTVRTGAMMAPAHPTPRTAGRPAGSWLYRTRLQEQPCICGQRYRHGGLEPRTLPRVVT